MHRRGWIHWSLLENVYLFLPSSHLINRECFNVFIILCLTDWYVGWLISSSINFGFMHWRSKMGGGEWGGGGGIFTGAAISLANVFLLHQ